MADATGPIRFTLRQLQYFVAVARTSQISQAAAECHVSQSTVTSAVAELEKALGALLFVRERTGVSLTHQGHLFLQHANRVLDAASDAGKNPFRSRSELNGTLDLTASYTVLGYFILPYIATFQKQNPGARIVPVEEKRAEIEEAVLNGSVELAVALTSNMIEPRRFHRSVLARSRRQLWVSAGHPLADQSQVTLADVSRYTYVLPTVDEGEVTAMKHWHDAGLRPASIVRTSSMEAVREMVGFGLAVTVLSDMVFRPWSLEGRRIRAIPLKDPLAAMEVGLIWSKGHRLGPLADAFRKYLEVAVGAHPKD